jgi:hypothetical protein
MNQNEGVNVNKVKVCLIPATLEPRGSQKQMEERRKEVRVSFKTEVVLSCGDHKIAARADSKDISLNGVFVYTDQRLPIGSFCNLDIMLTGSSSELSLRIIGKIAREGDEGIGIAFEGMDIDSYFHIRNIVRHNTLDWERAEPDIRSDCRFSSRF